MTTALIYGIVWLAVIVLVLLFLSGAEQLQGFEEDE